MAINKMKFLARFGFESKEDSIFRKALEVMGDFKLGASGRMFMPEGSAAAGATNQVRVNTTSHELEVHRAGSWKPVATSSMRYDSANTKFLGNTGTGEVALPHVGSDDYLKNVTKYYATNRGTATQPAYGFSMDANVGIYSSAAENLDFAVDGDQRLNLSAGSIKAKYAGVVTFEMNQNSNVSRKPFTSAEAFTSNKLATFNEVVTAKKKVTIETGGLEIQAADLNITGSGKLIAGGNVVAYSDKRIKDEIVTIDRAAERCSNVRGAYYRNKLSDQLEFGVIAQELEAEFPELVHTIVAQDADGEVLEDFRAVNYMGLVGVLLQAVNELNNRIEELESK